MSSVLNLSIPWITLAIALTLLLRAQRWIHRHLFGLGLISSNDKAMATILYLIFMLPGVVLRELSRWAVAGMVGRGPEFISPLPPAGDDGIVEVRFFHFLIVNPIYAGLVSAAPFITGMVAMLLISNNVLHIPDLLRTLGAGDAIASREAFSKIVSKPDFLVWAYLLFSIANIMLPTTTEFRATWFLWIIAGAVFVFLAIIGLFSAIYTLLAGPVTTLVFGLAAVFAAVFGLDLFAIGAIAVVEAVIGRLTNQKIEYQPAPKAASKALQPAPTNVFELRLPIPPQPGKTPAIKTGITIEKPEKPPVPGIGAPAAKPAIDAPPARPGLPAPASVGQNVPARIGERSGDLPKPPEKAGDLPLAPAKPLPGAPPPRQPAEEKVATLETPLKAPAPPPLSAPRPATAATPATGPEKAKTGGFPAFNPAAKKDESDKPAAVPAQKPAFNPGGTPPLSRQTGESKPTPPAFGGPTKPAPNKEPEPTRTAPPPLGKPPEKPAEKSSSPIGGPPALLRPNAPTPPTNDPARRTGAFGAFGSRDPKPAPKPGAGGNDKSRAEARSPSKYDNDDDVIEADVIDEDDDGEVSYVDADET